MAPEYRERGLGKILFDTLLMSSLERGFDRLFARVKARSWLGRRLRRRTRNAGERRSSDGHPLIHLAIGDRDGRWHELRFSTWEVVSWFYWDWETFPGGVHSLPDREQAKHDAWKAWSNRRRDWHRLPDALWNVHHNLTHVPIPGIGHLQILAPTVIPRRWTDPFVEFTVRLPSSVGGGARCRWDKLWKYGGISSFALRAYLAAIHYMDLSASNGMAITREIPMDGELVPNEATKYARLLSDRGLTEMIGLNPYDRQHRHAARAAFKRLNTDGVIDLYHDPTGGGYRILGPPVSLRNARRVIEKRFSW